jgi:hypothetical protein
MKKKTVKGKPQTKEEIRKELAGWLTGYDISDEKKPGGEDYRRSTAVKSYNFDEMAPKIGGKKKHPVYDNPEVNKLKGAAYFKELKRLEKEENAKRRQLFKQVKVGNKFKVIDNFRDRNIEKINSRESKFINKYENKVDKLTDRIEKAKREKTITNLNKKALRKLMLSSKV